MGYDPNEDLGDEEDPLDQEDDGLTLGGRASIRPTMGGTPGDMPR